MSHVYIAGTVLAIQHYGVQALSTAAQRLRDQSSTVTSPLEVARYYDIDIGSSNSEGRAFALAQRMLLRQLSWADMVAVLPGWESSQSTITDLAVTRSIGGYAYLYRDGTLMPVGILLNPLRLTSI